MKTTLKNLVIVTMLLGFIAAFAIQANAVEFKKQSFLNVSAIYLTNTFNPTNLATAGSVGTNWVGLTYTNNGVQFTADGTNQARANPFKDVNLFALTTGETAYNPSTNGVNFIQSYATITATMTAGSGADSAIAFVATPLYDGVNEATEAAEQWTFAFTPTVSSTQTFATNAPLYRWPGAAKLRIRRIVNSDTTASGNVILKELNLNGFPP
ncbi:MAG: hypothetical protein D4R57_01035 [Verrucomicrobiales bacterium]|nr:MAG: hypothetical protein D4R57_01035 [Verrucomicrobiales bacterium]